MGQYKKTLIQQRQAKNHDKKLDKLLRAVSKIIGARKWVIEQEVLEELGRQGYKIDTSRLRRLLKTLNPHLIVLGKEFYKLKKELGKDWKTVKELLDTALKKNLHREAIQIIQALRDDKQTLLHVAKDLYIKITNPHTDPYWWAQAWLQYTKKRGCAPAYPSPNAEYIQFNPPPRLKIKDNTPVQVHTPWLDKPILATAKKAGQQYRAHIKTQLQLLAQYIGKKYEQLAEEARNKRPILYVTPASSDHIGFLAKAHTRGRINIPQPAQTALKQHQAVFYTLHTPQGQKHTILKAGTTRTKTRQQKTYTETYIQHTSLKPGTYYIEAKTPKAFFKDFTLELSINDIQSKITRIAPEDAQKLSRYIYQLGYAELKISDGAIITATIQGDILKNKLYFTLPTKSLRDVELRLIHDLLTRENNFVIKIKNEVFDVKQILDYHVNIPGPSTHAYLFIGERKAGKRIMQRKVIAFGDEAFDQSHPRFHAIFSGYTPKFATIKPRLCLLEFDQVPIIDRGHEDAVVFTVEEDDFWQELLYWSSLKDTRKIGKLGEKIAQQLNESLKQYVSEIFDTENISSKYLAGDEKTNNTVDFTYEIEEKQVGFLEVSMGKDINMTLLHHLLPEAEKRFKQNVFQIGIIMAIHYNIEERKLRIIILSKYRDTPWQNITKYIFAKYR